MTTGNERDGWASFSGTGASQRRVELKRTINAPIRRVWDALTVEMPNWAGTLIEPHEGGRAAQGDADECGEGPVQDGTIKVLQPPYIFEFTWNDSLPDEGLVRYDLTELDEAHTLLTLVQYVPESQVEWAAPGLHQVVERFAIYVETGSVDSIREGRFMELHGIYRAQGLI
ncbi:MAG: hypothetical protein CMD83_11900 [Gammaproteobacteria bacterium]|nr:hypothetical protein [Gammaproteobacteria bacterium]